LNNKNKQILLHLSLIKGIGPASVLKIIKKLFEDFFAEQKNPQIQNLSFDLQKVYLYKVSDFVHVFELSSKIAQALFDGLQDKTSLEKELNLIEKYQIDLLTFLDEEYPQNLKEIYSPPIILYCKGAKFAGDKNIAVVGARKADNYAKQVIDKLIPALVEKKYTIISGGALGADSMAHQATLDAKGKTVAVIGSGLLNFYPHSNKNLFREIVKNGGTLVSPFPLMAPPEKGNFPARNRVIAGLGSGCLVVQAAQKSGALITAHIALHEGRQVFAVPGSIYDELSLGCHDLIKQGAKLVSSVDDILEELEEQDYNNKKVTLVKKTKTIEKTKQPKKNKKLKEEDPILKHMEKPSSVDEISCKVGLDLVELQNKLFDLQLEGKVKQNFAGYWEKL